MMVDWLEVRRGLYLDSVRLMQISKLIKGMQGVSDSIIAMATELNCKLLSDVGFETDVTKDASPNDLVIALRAEGKAELEDAKNELEKALISKEEAVEEGTIALTPRTITSCRRRGNPNLALISVPGSNVFVEAMDALEHGLNAMIFSDNVSLDEEIFIKRTAEKKNLLVMGPDCGTTILDGVGVGFSNVVRPGPVSIVGSSGTGIQQICCLLDVAGIGIRHAIGTGSRDLLDTIGGSTTLRALDALDSDPASDVIVILAKGSSQRMRAQLKQRIKQCNTPIVLSFLDDKDNTLQVTVERALKILDKAIPEFPSLVSANTRARQGRLFGLFCGGSLREEAHAIASSQLNIVDRKDNVKGHTLIDFGDDSYTLGRPHPMIDSTVRTSRLAECCRDTSIGVLLFDLVYGLGSATDPASELVPLIVDAVTRDIGVVVSVCGTSLDPQDVKKQAETIHASGASVFWSNAAAARYAAELASGARS